MCLRVCGRVCVRDGSRGFALSARHWNSHAAMLTRAPAYAIGLCTPPRNGRALSVGDAPRRASFGDQPNGYRTRCPVFLLFWRKQKTSPLSYLRTCVLACFISSIKIRVKGYDVAELKCQLRFSSSKYQLKFLEITTGPLVSSVTQINLIL